jgi:deazaflavin-dependent oxidoreductase (nitroreductase family)
MLEWTMDAGIQQALAQDRVIDITTTGRKSGLPRRIEIWFHRVGGHYYITGLPGKRDWYANLQANPEFTFHLKESVKADLPARALPVLERDRRWAILGAIIGSLDRTADLQRWVDESPLVEVFLDAN